MARLKGKKMAITGRAAIQRINRKLAEDGRFVRANRRWEASGPGAWDGLRYWVIDGGTKGSVDAFDDLEKYGRKLGVIAEYEEVEEQS